MLTDDERIDIELRLARLLSGTALRHHLTVLLMEAGGAVRTVADLVGAIHREGFTLPGRDSKVVSDTLRWEVGHQRVRRVGRGRYVRGTMPKSTSAFLRRRVRDRRRRLAAAEAAAQARWLETLTISPVM